MLYAGLDYHRSFSYITTMNDKEQTPRPNVAPCHSSANRI